MSKMFPGIDAIPVENRAKLLEDQAYEVKEEFVRRNYTEEEITEREKSLTKLTNEKLTAQDELKELSAPLKATIKEKDTAIRSVARQLHDGFFDNYEKVYRLVDYNEKMVHTYDAEGYLIHSRPMTEREAQTKLKIAN